MRAWTLCGGFRWKSGEGHGGHARMDELSIPKAGSIKTSLPANSWLRGLAMGAVADLFSCSSPHRGAPCLSACPSALPLTPAATDLEHALEVSCDFPQPSYFYSVVIQ